MRPLWPEGVGREVHARLDSTNAEGLRRAAAGEAGPLWILALEQTAARGRRGRAWSTPRGNFAASLLCRPAGETPALALRGFVAALGLHDTLAALTGRPQDFALKWPNDVLVAGRKLAGILLATAGPPGRAPALVIGIGVNLATVPDPALLEEGALLPACLAETGVGIAPEAFLDRLAPQVAAREAELVRAGFAPLREAWLARAAGLGAPVTARLPGRSVSGILSTIDATGALVLQTAAGRETLPAADLHFAPARPEPVRAARH